MSAPEAAPLPAFMVDEDGEALTFKCREQPELFTGGDYPDPPALMASQAKRVCQVCPVQAACLAYALEADEPFGVWGGATRRERKALLRHRRRESTAA